MKRLFSCIVLLCLSFYSYAQTYNFDVNGDGVENMEDVTFLVNHLLGRVYSISLDKTELTLDVDANYTLTATVIPADASVKWDSSNTDVATVSSKGKVMAVEEGEATITCYATDGSGMSATCKVVVSNPSSSTSTYTFDGVEYPMPEAVDLGLPSGTKWADTNFANSSCFAWADIIEPDDDLVKWFTYGNWSNYKWSNADGTLTKYNDTDKLTKIEDCDNVVSLNAPLLDIPTNEQFQELIDNTDQSLSDFVISFKSKINGNTLTLPFNSLAYAPHWTKSLCTYDKTEAYCYKCYATNDIIDLNCMVSECRYQCCPIRPVFK